MEINKCTEGHYSREQRAARDSSVNQHGTDMGVWYITKELVLNMQDALSLHK